jgi:hypothetical protein
VCVCVAKKCKSLAGKKYSPTGISYSSSALLPFLLAAGRLLVEGMGGGGGLVEEVVMLTEAVAAGALGGLDGGVLGGERDEGCLALPLGVVMVVSLKELFIATTPLRFFSAN